MKKSSLVVCSALLLVLAAPSLAQDATPSSTTRPIFRQAAVEERQEAREDRMTQVQASREEFKSKMMEIKDARRQKVAAALEEGINKLNMTMTGEMKRHIERLSAITDKMASRAAKVKDRGGDVASAEAQIEEVRADLITLRTAVDEQAVRTYAPAITATDSSSLRTAFKSVHEQFKTDIKSLRAQSQDVKEKMHAVLKTLSEIQQGLGTTTNEEKVGTGSAGGAL